MSTDIKTYLYKTLGGELHKSKVNTNDLLSPPWFYVTQFLIQKVFSLIYIYIYIYIYIFIYLYNDMYMH